jgi:hypothetical protein
MARNALEAVFGALGGGLVGYGKDKTARMDREEERLARELAARQTAERNRMSMLGMGFDPEEELQQRETTLGAAGAGLGAIPMSGTMGPALDAAARQMQSDRSRGRSFTLGDERWAQPFSRTQEGREERATQAEQARDERLARQVRERDAARATEEKEITRIKTTAEANADLRLRRQRADALFRQLLRDKVTEPSPSGYGPGTKREYTTDERNALQEEIYGQQGLNIRGDELPVGASEAGVSSASEPPRPALKPGTSRRDRWEELKRAGFAGDRATAIVREEMP